jgi:RPA family protein
MSFRTNTLFRISIKDLYESELIEEGNIYSLKNNEGIFYNLVLIQGYLIETSEIKGREDQTINKLFVNDFSAGIWVHTSDSNLLQDISQWDFIEVIGTVEFLPNEEGNSLELFIRPKKIQLLNDPKNEILHVFDTKVQKKNYPQILEKMKYRSQQETDSQYREIKETEKDVSAITSNDTEGSTAGDEDQQDLDSMIIKIIKENDSGEGVALEIIKKKLDQTHPTDENELEDLIFNLQMEGDLYEPTFRRYRVND